MLMRYGAAACLAAAWLAGTVSAQGLPPELKPKWNSN